MGKTSSQSRIGTAAVISVPADNIGPFYVAPDREEIRLFIRNTGPTVLLLAYASSVVNGATVFQGSSDRFPLAAGADAVFILAPRQGVYAVSVGGGGQVSFHASPALPFSPLVG